MLWSGAVCPAAAILAGFVRQVQWVFVAAIGISVLAFIVLLGTGVPDVIDWAKERGKQISRERRRPLLELPDLWRTTTDGADVPSLMTTLQKELSHPGYMAQIWADRPSSVKIGTLVACEQMGEIPSTTGLRNELLRFLGQQPVRDLVGDLTSLGRDFAWHSYVSNGRMTNGAVLAPSADQAEAPVASALLNLHEIGTRTWGTDQRFAELLLHVQPRPDAEGHPTVPFTLEEWFHRLLVSLELPRAFADFLRGSLGLSIYDDPPVQLGIRLDAYPDLGALIDTRGFEQVPGSAITNNFYSYIVAVRGGKSSQRVAVETLRLWCDHAVHIAGYESRLARLQSDQNGA
jgi:hypothetical protein